MPSEYRIWVGVWIQDDGEVLSQWWSGLTCHPLVLVHWVKSTVTTPFHKEHFEKKQFLYRDSDFIFQKAQTAKGTILVRRTWCYWDWLASNRAWLLTPQRINWVSSRERLDTPEPPMQMATWASWSLQQNRRLISDQVIHTKGAETTDQQDLIS